MMKCLAVVVMAVMMAAGMAGFNGAKAVGNKAAAVEAGVVECVNEVVDGVFAEKPYFTGNNVMVVGGEGCDHMWA